MVNLILRSFHFFVCFSFWKIIFAPLFYLHSFSCCYSREMTKIPFICGNCSHKDNLIISREKKQENEGKGIKGE